MMKKNTKKILIVGLSFGLLLTFYLSLISLKPSYTKAQEHFNVISSRTETNFPDSLTFKLSVSAAYPIQKIYLRYRLLNEFPIQVFSEVWPNFRPSNSVETSWIWQMKKTGGLPPATEISYRWLVADERGNKIETPSQTAIYFDTRYAWQWLEKDNLILFWARGERDFAENLMGSAQRALERLEADTGTRLEKRIKIFIYPSTEDLRKALLYATEWTGGIAFSEFNTVAVGIAPWELFWGERALAHELAHLVVKQISFNFYGDVPYWLNEGIAMRTEGAMRPEMARELEQAIQQKNFPTLRTLSSPFPSDISQALLSYAVSQSVVELLLEKHGNQKMLELLKTFKAGSGYDEALKKVYGFDMDGLFDLWRTAILSREMAFAPPHPNSLPQGERELKISMKLR